MLEQAFLLIFLLLATAVTLFLYVWKSKKEIEYRRDERWQTIQNLANRAANSVNILLLVGLAAADTVIMLSQVQITLSWSRFATCCLLFIGLRNALELTALFYYDRRM